MPSDQSTEAPTGAESGAETTSAPAPETKTRPMKSQDTVPASSARQQSLPLGDTANGNANVPETPEFFDYVHDGNSYQLPGALQSVIKTQGDAEKDYRQNTWALAVERRGHQAQREQWQQQQRMEQQ